jgi:SAM-dependent methyltransferase
MAGHKMTYANSFDAGRDAHQRYSRDADFAIFFDSQLSDPAPYDSGATYFRKAKPRQDFTLTLISEQIKGARILDIGASPFYMLDRALALGAKDVTGIYYSTRVSPLDRTPILYSTHGVINISKCDIEKDRIALPDNSADLILACEILEHFDHFPFKMAEEIHRILSPCGYLCLTVPNVASISNIVKLLIGKNIFMQYCYDTSDRHKHEYTAAQLRDFVSYLGLEVVSAGVMPFASSDNKLALAVYKLIARLPFCRRYAQKLYIIAKQPEQKPMNLPATPPASLYRKDLPLGE